MTSALTITFPVEAAIQKLQHSKEQINETVNDILNVKAIDIETLAKQGAPVDMGGLRSAISADNSKQLEKHIIVNAFYAAFIEFGTGKYAAQYVGTLPATWSAYAAQFKGQTGGQQNNFLEKIQEWVRRKGLGTGKNYKSIGYLIFRSILINGVHPHPFLFPAYEQQRPEIVKDIESFLKSLGG